MSSSQKNESSPSPAPVNDVESLQRLVRQQQQTIEKLEGQLKTQQEYGAATILASHEMRNEIQIIKSGLGLRLLIQSNMAEEIPNSLTRQ
jgi:cell division septum initiation protein DivIVA